MKSRGIHISVPLIPLLLAGSCVLALGSWVASLYGVGEVQSLLSAEGLRHEVRSALRQYMACPELAVFLMLVPGVGLAVGSGFLGAVGRSLSATPPLSKLQRGDASVAPLIRRERRSLNWGFSVLLLYVGLVSLAVVGPWACLRSVSGGLFPSPFIHGLPLLLSAGLALTGCIYGYASGRFHRYADIRSAMAMPLRRLAYYPVALFFVVRLFGQLAYTRLPQALGLGEGIMVGTFHLAAIVLLLSEMRKVR
jgi:aminobenzoyl-glutamate transport protein